ncbi:formylglycine-generating enzyme family protein [Pontiella sulfatireligans]|uniref:Serine/threonine-protein kinase pkn1 n=1 Tax=Pontiella sulfatireligans TaxID=2750658 RepID=A0A6C2UQC5_9BACT|nr:formylglycine-generating enzyme family protein [Pontiella sulfatireligans]VGO21504.1 Serine/threonine-protein kinase pkn1 [Pontiella sulfatireligans]
MRLRALKDRDGPVAKAGSSLVVNILFTLVIAIVVGVAWFVLKPLDSGLKALPAEPATEINTFSGAPLLETNALVSIAEVVEELPPSAAPVEAEPQGDSAEGEWVAALAEMKTSSGTGSYASTKKYAPYELEDAEEFATLAQRRGSAYWASEAVGRLDASKAEAARRAALEGVFLRRMSETDVALLESTAPDETRNLARARKNAEQSVGSAEMEGAYAEASRLLDAALAESKRQLKAAGRMKAQKAAYDQELEQPQWDAVREAVDSDAFGTLFQRPKGLYANAGRNEAAQRNLDAAELYAVATASLKESLQRAVAEQSKRAYDEAVRDALTAKGEMRWKDLHAALTRAEASGYLDQTEANELRAYWEEKLLPVATASAKYNREVDRAGVDLLNQFGGIAWKSIEQTVNNKWESSSPTRIAATYDKATKQLQPVLYDTYLSAVKTAVVAKKWDEARRLSALMLKEYPRDAEMRRVAKAVSVHDLRPVAGAGYAPLDYEVKKKGFLFLTKTETHSLAPGSARARSDQQKAVAGLKLGLEVESGHSGIRMRLIPRGAFSMGAAKGAYAERPVHDVVVSKPFYFGKYEVTNAQWKRVMGRAPGNGAAHAPVAGVSWKQCQAFVEKLCKLEGVPPGTYRLPTEAEWEYACRAGTSGSFCCGDSADLYVFSNTKDRKASNKKEAKLLKWTDDRYAGFAPAGSYRPNAWGLHDMHGNAWEWVEDAYGEYEALNISDPCVRQGAERVCRGGAASSEVKDCRAAVRLHVAPEKAVGNIGFRIVRTVPPKF